MTSTGNGRPAGARGFTLVELVMVIALASAVLVMISTVMSRPLQGFVDQNRRVELVDLAATALNRMARDVRLAVPNSLRVSDSQTLELLLIDQAGRYRANQDPVGDVRYDPPRCPISDDCTIEVLSPGLDSASVSGARWMVIYNIGGTAEGDNIWPPPSGATSVGSPTISVISPRVTVSYTDAKQSPSGIDTPSHLSLSGGGINAFQFKYASLQHRFYLAREALGYRCDNAGTDSAGNGTGIIRRASFSSLAASYTYSAANSAVLVDSVASCQFSYASGTSTRGGLVSLRLTLKKNNEEVVLLQQVHVDNAP